MLQVIAAEYQARVSATRAFLHYVVTRFIIVEIDRTSFFDPEYRVFLIRQILAFVLLALWMPATQHCGLESAGLINAISVDESVACCAPTAPLCAYDSCHVIEQFTPKTSNDSLQVPTPDFVACACFLCVQLLDHELSTGSVVSIVATDQPIGWVPRWHFARRAASLPRAPAILV